MPELRPVFAVLGVLIATLGAAMLPCALVDLAADSDDWRVFAASGLVTSFVGIAMANTMRAPPRGRLSIRQAFLLTTLAWTGMAVFAALPFVWSSTALGPAGAYFEAMSGLTTTGSTVIAGLDEAPPGLLLWRSMLQWMGGIGIIVIAVSVLPSLQVAGMQLFHTESSDRSEKILPRAAQIGLNLVGVYLVLTLACALAYGLGGMNAFEALNHAMTTVSTGGYSTRDSSLGGFESAWIEWTAIVFMLTGAMPFVHYILAARGRPGPFLRSREVRLLVASVAGFTLLGWIAAEAGGWESGHEALRHAMFNTVSLMTTTGYAAVDYTDWGAFSDLTLFVVMFLGGCTGSTSGGLKMMRLQIIAQTVAQSGARLLHPSGVTVIRFDGRLVGDDVVASTMGFLFVYLAAFALIAAGLSTMGLDAVSALSASIAALGNVGPGLGPQVGPAGNFAALPDPALWLLSLAMLLGRLELFTVLVILMPRFWRG